MDVLTHRDLGSWELDSANFDETKIGRGSGTHLDIILQRMYFLCLCIQHYKFKEDLNEAQKACNLKRSSNTSSENN